MHPIWANCLRGWPGRPALHLEDGGGRWTGKGGGAKGRAFKVGSMELGPSGGSVSVGGSAGPVLASFSR